MFDMVLSSVYRLLRLWTSHSRGQCFGQSEQGDSQKTPNRRKGSLSGEGSTSARITWRRNGSLEESWNAIQGAARLKVDWSPDIFHDIRENGKNGKMG